MSAQVSPLAAAEHGHDGDETCAVCYGAAFATRLPCSCLVTLCEGCWAKAVLASLDARGLPRCPSCRAGFVADVHPATGKMRLVKVGGSQENAEGPSQKQELWHFSAKARRKAQIRLLQEYGEDTACRIVSALAGAGVLDKADPVGAEPETWASMARPPCVCGAMLHRVDLRGRLCQVLEQHAPGWTGQQGSTPYIEEALAKLSKTKVRCNLCGRSALRSGWCWSCAGCSRTQLHPEGNDLCHRCVEKHSRQLVADQPRVGGHWRKHALRSFLAGPRQEARG